MHDSSPARAAPRLCCPLCPLPALAALCPPARAAPRRPWRGDTAALRAELPLKAGPAPRGAGHHRSRSLSLSPRRRANKRAAVYLCNTSATHFIYTELARGIVHYIQIFSPSNKADLVQG